MDAIRAFQNPNGGDFRDLKKFAKPRKCYESTQSTTKVLDMVKKKSENKVIHIYGMSGSGKSQTLAKVCDCLNEDPGRTIWHVQCQPGINKFLPEMRKFANKLQTAGFITKEDEVALRSAVEDDQNQMWKFVDVLNRIDLSVPALIAVEDIRTDSDGRRLIKALIEAMMNVDAEVLNVQLLIVSREREVLYIEEDLDALTSYVLFEVNGFTEKEATGFLKKIHEVQRSSDEMLAKLARELRYSPLRLLLAKSYCHKYKMSYDTYYASLGKDDDIMKKEKDYMKEHPDLGEYHGYDVIVKLFRPTENSDEEMRLQYEVMQMMSFLNYCDIPSVLLEKFFQVVMGGEAKRHQSATLALRERLRREVDADERDLGGVTLVTVHADILRAINVLMTAESKHKVLKNVVFALAALLDKDNRMKKEYGLLYDLKAHAEVVVIHAADHGITAASKDCRILLGLSRLNEGIGFAISQHPGFREGNEEEKYYGRALDCVWMVVCSHFEKSFVPSWLTKKRTGDKAKQLIHFENGKDPKKTAKEMYKMAKEASLKNESVKEALKADKEWLFPVKVAHISDMQKKLAGGDEIDWSAITRKLTETGRLTDEQKEQLLKHKVIIEWKRYVEIYLVERMASILHSRGRQDNYKWDIISQDMRDRCPWYVELGFQLCDVAFQKSGIKLLFHYILRANNKLPRLARNREGESDLEFRERIKEARETALSLKNEDGDFYEHGIYKLISGTPWTMLNALKYLVKANTKVHKRPGVLNNFSEYLPDADNEAEELYELAKNNPKIVISTTCLVHAGKYFAARGQLKKAIETFELAFENGINDKLETNRNTYSWALYNLGRAIQAAGEIFEERKRYKKRFDDRYKLTMDESTPIRWRDLLDKCKEKLDE